MKNERNNRVEQNKISRFKFKIEDFANVVIIFILAIIAIMSLVLLGVIIKAGGENEISTADIIGNITSAISTSLIGMVITVWAGLNVVNLIERKELRELRSNINQLEHKNCVLNETLEKGILVYSEDFYRELFSNNEDSVASMLGDELKKLDISELYMDLLCVEKLFKTVYERHESKFRQDFDFVNKAQEGILLVQKIHERIIQIENNTVVEGYLNYRIAGFYFYKGYCLTGGEKFKSFRNAIGYYVKCANNLNLVVPEYNGTSMENLGYQGKEEDIVGASYLVHFIGESYSKIAHEYNSLKDKTIETGEVLTIEKLYEYAKKAVFYCQCVVDWTQNTSKRELYYRNLGCAYERMDKIMDLVEHNQEIEEFPNYSSLQNEATIMQMYKAALYLIKDDYKIQPYRVDAIYHTVLSYYEKWFKKRIFGVKWINSKNGFKEAGDITEIIKSLQDNTEEIIEELYLYVTISEIATMERSRKIKKISLNGFAYSYVVLFLLAENAKAKNIFYQGIEYYMEKIRRNINVQKMMRTDYEKEPSAEDLIEREKILSTLIK